MANHTVQEWVDSLFREDLEFLLDNHKPTRLPPLQHPWNSPNLRQIIVEEAPERVARQYELMTESDLQLRYRKGVTRNYPPLARMAEMRTEWEDVCRLSKVILGLQGRSLPKFQESEKSLRLRLSKQIKLAQDGRDEIKRAADSSPFHHLNLYGGRVHKRSATPAPVSFWAARSFVVGYRNSLLSRSRKRIADRVRAAEASKYLDPVVDMDPEIALAGQGSALCRAALHRVTRAYKAGQGNWDPGEALAQGPDMELTSNHPSLNSRVAPFVITRQHNDQHVNDDGRWHAPKVPRKGTSKERRPSPLRQVQAQNEIEEEDVEVGEYLPSVAWSGDRSSDWTDGHSANAADQTELDDASESSSEDLGQYKEGHMWVDEEEREEEEILESDWKDGPPQQDQP